MIAQPAGDYLAARSCGTLCLHDNEHGCCCCWLLYHPLFYTPMLLIARIFECVSLLITHISISSIYFLSSFLAVSLIPQLVHLQVPLETLLDNNWTTSEKT